MYLLFDIGGTKMRLALSKDGEVFNEPKVVPTPKDFTEAMKVFKEVADGLLEGRSIEKAVGGMRGPFNKDKTIIVNSSALPLWDNKPLKEELEKAVGAPVFIENDTAIVGLGEMHSGAGKGAEIGVYITVSTGVGGARFVDGKIDKSTFGFEPGHQIVDIEEDGDPVSLEDLVSGTALEERTGKKAYEVTDPAIWDELAKTFAYGLYNIILQWSPSIVVLGGPMIVGDPSMDVEVIKKYLNEINTKFPELPEIKEAELGDFGGLHGALAFIKQQKKVK
ncbi:ROK family protein [bacterium]|jgi:predicted NBD/HSP70 family sugar kinase|nr:ROK family protein [bacterium]MBT3730237.1 ROK family protein [bacterium]MBT4894963.1 ROK family protein [bacterium]